MPARTNLYTVDAFADDLFSGNPAAVCPLESPAPEAAMQALAAEMNLSETAFAWPEPGGWRLRWFTPTSEVKLCGHATLATAHVLWTSGLADAREPLLFHTLSGPLEARRTDRGIEMDFPAVPVQSSEPDGLSESIERALNISDTPVAIGRNGMDLLVELRDEAAVRALGPDFPALAELDARGVIVTSRAGAATAEARGADFVSRFFAPAVGVPEDPVTGSAHCALGPWWADKLGRNRLRGMQVSRRGGIVDVICEGDRVRLAGAAITVLAATLAEDVRLALRGGGA